MPDRNKGFGLVVIDMSEEQWHQGPGGSELIPNWPGIPNILSLAKALPSQRVMDSRLWMSPEDHSTLHYLFPDVGIAGTKKAELCKELVKELAPISTFVKKVQYSAFFGSKLHEMLQPQGVKTVMLTGINTDWCVFASALDAFYLGYEVWLIKDACWSFSGKEGHDKGIADFERFIQHRGKVLSTEEALKLLN